MSSLQQQSNSPGLNTGQLDAQNVSDGTSINLFQGNLSMPVEVVSLPGLNNLNCEINLIYQSQVSDRVDQWNLDDTPGVVGLGWGLPFPQIIKNEKLNGTDSDDEYFLTEQGNPTRLIAISNLSTDQIEYELENYAFNRITYFPALEKWEIQKEDGTLYIYGGQEQTNALEWGIRWNNWIGPSLVTKNQERYVKAWNLARVENIYGNFYSLTYQVKEQSVGQGTLTYTKECHVNEIQNDLGWSLKFNYKPMVYDYTSLNSPKEYLDPHRDPNLPGDSAFSDGFQSCYSTVYLDWIALYNQTGDEITCVQLDYYDLKNLTPPINNESTARQQLVYGATYKRYLKSIQRYYGGETKPGTRFCYNFTQDIDQPRGCLTQIIYPGGGQSVFNYQKISVGGNNQNDPGSRNQCIQNPFGQDKLAKPRIWYGNDYTISAWYDEEQNQLQVNVFTWVGHWCISQADWWCFDGVIELDKLQLMISENSFLLTIPYDPRSSKGANTDIFLFYRDHLNPTNWVQWNEIGIGYETTQVVVENGQQFFLVYDSENGLMHRYFWHPFQRDFVMDEIPLNTKNDYYFTAYSNYYILYSHNASENEASEFSISYYDQFFDWKAGSTLTGGVSAPSINGQRYCHLSASDSFVAIASITGQGETDFNSELNILMWDPGFTNLRFVELEQPWGDERNPFKYLPLQIMPYLGPTAIDNALVACGPNCYYFDGLTWHFQTTGIKNDGDFKNPEDQFYWYAFQRFGLLTTENTQSGIDSYLTYQDISGWQAVVLDSYSEESQSKRAKLSYPTFVGNYLSTGNRVYSNPLSQSWQNIDEYLIEEFQVDNLTIDTTTMINQAPFFLAFMTVDEEGKPYDTRIGFFRNGDLLRTETGEVDLEILPGQQLTKLLNKNYEYQTSLNGKLPAIAQGFVTYSIETDLDKATSIVLHHYANESLQDPIQTFVVQQMTSDSGYNQVHKCYEYENVSAAQDSTQTIIRFQKVTEYQGSLKPEDQTDGYTISYFANGLPKQYSSEVTLFPCALDGVLLKKEHYDSTHNLVSFVETESEVVTQIARSWDDSSLRNLYGAFVQTKSKTTMLDGVSTQIELEYLDNSGRVQKTTTSYWDSRGQTVTEQKVFTYGYEKYPALREVNRLTELIQTKVQTKVDQETTYQTKYCKTQTYKEWAFGNHAYWDIAEEYLAKKSDATFDWENSLSSPNDWLCTKTIIQRDSQGNVIECQDAENIHATVLYDDLGRFPTASFTNASLSEGVFYESFEPYQSSNISFDQTGGDFYDQDAFTGTTCYQMTQSGTLTKKTNIQSNGHRRYCLSAWLKTNDLALSTLEFQITNDSQTLTKTVVPSSGWFQFQWVIDTDNLKTSTTSLAINLVVDITEGTFVRLDHLAFRPVDSQFNAEIYDPILLRLTATLGNNGFCDRVFYNQFNDQQALVGAFENVIGFRTGFLASNTLSRETSTNNPNHEFTVRGQKPGFYDTFHENALESYTFLNSSKEDWNTQQGKLSLITPSETNPLGARVERQSFQSNNVAVCVYAPAISAQSFCVGLGTLFVIWDGSWNLSRLKENQELEIIQQNSQLDFGFGREWIFVVVQNRVLFFTNGVKVFDISLSEPEPPGPVQLGMQQPGSFEQLLVAEELELDINFTDGFGKLLQTLRWESYQSVIVDGILYDNCGREAIQLKPTQVTTPSLNYLTGWVNRQSDSLWKGEGIEGDINDYYPEDQGYPFEQQQYEPSPLDRVSKKGRPGKEFAITPDNAHVELVAYGTNTQSDCFKYTLPANQYFIQTTTDPDGKTTHYYRDMAQHIIGVVQEGANGNRLASRVYDPNGDIIEAVPPNYYDGEMDESGVVVYQYDFLGRQIESTHPDTGQARFIYNASSLVRAYQDAQACINGFVNYIKYDNLGRVLEKGYLEQEWDAQILQTGAENPTWPDNGTWTVRYVYDGDDSTPHMLGNLWKAFTANGDAENPLLEVFEYDRLNCLTACQTTQSSGFIVKLHSTYNCRGILETTQDDQTNLTISRRYNPLGQLVQLDGSADELTIPTVQYSYSASGMVQSMELNTESESVFQRTLNYNSTQWLTQIQDPSFQEQLSYTSNSCDSAGYYNGNIAGQSIQLTDQTQQESCFEVDEWNRLVAAQNQSVSELWEIDASNNFKKWTTDSVTRTFETVTNRNQLLAIHENEKQSSYTYTPNGETDSISHDNQTIQFVYSSGNGVLKRVQRLSTEWTEFEYNGENLRSSKFIYSNSQLVSQRLYAYHESEKPCLIVDQMGNETKTLRLVNALFLTIAFDGQKSYFALPDHLGSTRTVLDDSGNVCGQYDYTTYGSPTVLQQPPINYNYLFTGHEYDFESGFYNAQIRLYDPTIGRFLMTDPKAEFFSPYVYVGNNPLMSMDPTGQMSTKAVGWLAMAVGFVAAIVTGGVLAPAAAASLGLVEGGIAATALAIGTSSVAGTFASQAVTSIGNQEAFFTKDLGIALAADLAGGFAGAGAGAAIGKGMKYAGSKVASTAISGTSKGLSKTTKKVGQEMVKEMTNKVADSVVYTAISGDDWDATKIIGGAVASGFYKGGKKYRQLQEHDGTPELISVKKLEDASDSTTKLSTRSSTQTTSTPSPKSKPTSSSIAEFLRSGLRPERTPTFSFKRRNSWSPTTSEFAKTQTSAKDLHADVMGIPGRYQSLNE
uniref:DUF6443 domain-containing protein n=1 Tax=Pseudobryopsis hainanensis TaxID=2320808 RepID=A0A386AXT5_9CHLO|nr:hypothetical protein [Pseudobryopsis hainanensis]